MTAILEGPVSASRTIVLHPSDGTTYVAPLSTVRAAQFSTDYEVTGGTAIGVTISGENTITFNSSALTGGTAYLTVYGTL